MFLCVNIIVVRMCEWIIIVLFIPFQQMQFACIKILIPGTVNIVDKIVFNEILRKVIFCCHQVVCTQVVSNS